jgi:hypothetical protein
VLKKTTETSVKKVGIPASDVRMRSDIPCKFLFCTASRQFPVPILTNHSVCGHSMVQAESRRSVIVEAQPVHVRSVVFNVVLEQDFLQLLPFSLVRIIPKIFYDHLHLHVILTGRQRGEAWEPSKKQCFFRYRETLDKRVLSL